MRTSAHTRGTVRAWLAGTVALTALMVTVPLSGCGGGSHKGDSLGAVSRAKGQATISITWPERNTRLIPDAANSIVVTMVRQPDADFSTARTYTSGAIPRPAPGQPLQVSYTFNNLELGNYSVTAVAYPSALGATDPATPNNNAVAQTTVTTTIVAGANSLPPVTMGSTIASLALQTNYTRINGQVRLRPGSRAPFAVVALDAAGNAILTTPGKLALTTTDATVASLIIDPVVPGGVLAVAVAPKANPNADSTVTLTVTDQESGKSASFDVVVSPVGLATAAQWSKFHGDTVNTGQAPTTVPNIASGKLGWNYITNSSVEFASPAIAQDGTVYIGTKIPEGNSAGQTNDQTLFALDKNGSLKWQFKAGGDIECAPILAQDGGIIFGSTDGSLYVLKDKGTTYEVVWTKKLAGPIFGSPTLTKDGILYVATTEPDKKVYAFDSLNGDAILIQVSPTITNAWQFTDIATDSSQQFGIYTSPAVSPDETTLYVASLDGTVYAIYSANPTVPTNRQAQRVWRSPLGAGNIQSSPVVGTTGPGGTPAVFIGTFSNNGGTMFALRADTGGTLWSYDAQGQIYSTPALSRDNSALYLATLDVTSGTDDHKIVALRTVADAMGNAAGSEIWRTPVPDPITGVPFFSGGFTSSPALSGDGTQLYIGSFNGSIYSVGTAAGAILWSVSTPASPGRLTNNLESSPAIGVDGKVYLGGFDGTIYQFVEGP